MRKALQLWPVRVGALVLIGIVLYGAAYTVLPHPANRVSVTVLQCATIQATVVYDCSGTTLFHRTFADEATVAAVRRALATMRDVGLFINVACTREWEQSRIYSFDLLWHGLVVQTYVAPTNRESRYWWDVTTIGAPQAATEGPTTWKEVVRLTGMPDVPIPAP